MNFAMKSFNENLTTIWLHFDLDIVQSSFILGVSLQIGRSQYLLYSFRSIYLWHVSGNIGIVHHWSQTENIHDILPNNFLMIYMFWCDYRILGKWSLWHTPMAASWKCKILTSDFSLSHTIDFLAQLNNSDLVELLIGRKLQLLACKSS